MVAPPVKKYLLERFRKGKKTGVTAIAAIARIPRKHQMLVARAVVHNRFSAQAIPRRYEM